MVIATSLLLLFGVPFIFGLSVVSLLRPTFPSLSLIEIPGVAFAFGLCVLVIPCTLGYLIQGSTLGFISASLLLAILVCVKQHANLKATINLRMSEQKNWLLWLAIIIFCIHSYYLGNYLVLSSDSIHHLSYIKKFASSQRLLIENFQLSASYPIDELVSTYIYNALFPLFSYVSQITNINPILLWKYSAAVFVFTTFSVFYSSSMRFFNSHISAIISIILIVFYWGIPQNDRTYGIWALKSVSYPNQLTALSFIVLISFMYQELRLLNLQKGSNRNLILYFALGGFLPFLHLQWWVFFIFSCSILIMLAFFNVKIKMYKPITLGLSIFLLISGPLLALKFPYYLKCCNNMTSYQFVDFLIFKFLNLQFFNPFMVFRPFSIILLLTMFAFLIFTLKRENAKRKSSNQSLQNFQNKLRDESEQIGISADLLSQVAEGVDTLPSKTRKQHWFMSITRDPIINPTLSLSLLCASIAIFLLSPFAVNLAAKFMTIHVIARMTWPMDMLLIILVGHIISCTILNSKYTPKMLKIGKITYLNFVLLFIIGISIISPTSILNYRTYGPHSLSSEDISFEPLLFSNDFQNLIDKIKPRSVLLSPRFCNEYILTFADLLTTYPSHRVTEKEKEAYNFISPIFMKNSSPQEVYKLLSQIPVDYILLRPEQSAELTTNFDKLCPVLVKKFDKQIKELDNINCRFVLYEVDHKALKKALVNF